jgi:hypothetical protein
MGQKPQQRQPVGREYRAEFNLLNADSTSLRPRRSRQRGDMSEANKKLEALWASGRGEDLDEFLSELGKAYVEEGRVKWDPPPDLDAVTADYFSWSVRELNNRLQAGAVRIDEDGNIRPA